MTRGDYLRQLDSKLKRLPVNKRSDIIEDISSHFEAGGESGLSDDELSRRLGAPDALAKAYAMEFATEQVREHTTFGNVMRMIWSAIGMGLLNVMFALPVWVFIAGVWVSLAVAGLTAAGIGLFSSIVALIDWIHPLASVYVPQRAVIIFGGIAVSSLGALAAIASWYLGKKLIRLLVRFLQMNKYIIIRRDK